MYIHNDLSQGIKRPKKKLTPVVYFKFVLYALKAFVFQKMKNKKRSSQPKRINSDKAIDAIFSVIEWSIFSIFCILAAYFMNGVLTQYQAKDTFMAQSLQPITKLPTIVICLESNYSWDFTTGLVYVDYGMVEISYEGLKENATVRVAKSNESVTLNQITHRCLKIKSEVGSKEVLKFHTRKIRVRFNDIVKNYIPSSIKAYFTSEENSYGVFNSQWFDGKPFEKEIRLNHRAFLTLEPYLYEYLDQGGQCSNKSFLEQLKPRLLIENFSECPKKCAPRSFFISDEFPLCGWNSTDLESQSCPFDVIFDAYNEFQFNDYWIRPCRILEYAGQTTYDKKVLSEDEFEIYYSFQPPGMIIHSQERLMFDLIGMVGSVGGTLGMCIGFSFSGITSDFLNFIRSRVKTFFRI